MKETIRTQYSLGNCIEYLMIMYNGTESQKEYMKKT